MSAVKKRTKQSFLYRYRFILGYLALMVVFFILLCFLPRIAPGGLSQAEMDSVVAANEISFTSATNENVINLPYYLLQKASVSIFGLSLYSIKLPSIIIGALAAFFIVLLLNRWFKSDVAIVGSILTTLSTAFLEPCQTGNIVFRSSSESTSAAQPSWLASMWTLCSTIPLTV